MCMGGAALANPYAAGAASALSLATTAAQTREGNAVANSMNRARDRVFDTEQGRQDNYQSQMNNAFNAAVTPYAAPIWTQRQAFNARNNAMQDLTVPPPSSLKLLGSSPSSVYEAAARAASAAAARSRQTAERNAHLSAYGDVFPRMGIESVRPQLQMATIADNSQRSGRLSQAEAQAAAYNAYRPPSPFLDAIGLGSQVAFNAAVRGDPKPTGAGA